ncbi:bifunctional nicotinamidase/pyrazinamidase [Methylocapsa sp. S129]|uniref:bifunctional nicotinamidase/pyrazinamidase n=1 Tax=Methylocapsa sp. S129 TaxID=1641869 RepID=UPI00131DC61A|nr:bifunctional nicotinamidase/pyrazinamidase [Methylocapsa sp. S129]
MPATIAIDERDVLLVIDMQNDFMPGGALAVAGGDSIVPLVNRLAQNFANVVLTQDWHPPGHISFASSHGGARPFETIGVAYGDQTLWPDHCVLGSPGAALHKGLTIDHAILILRKGYNVAIDSYSAFAEADGETPTGLAGFLREKNIRRVFACGLATDYCVAWSALDARSRGFETFVIEDACRAIDAQGSLGAAWAKMEIARVQRIESTEITAKNRQDRRPFGSGSV